MPQCQAAYTYKKEVQIEELTNIMFSACVDSIFISRVTMVNMKSAIYFFVLVIKTVNSGFILSQFTVINYM